MAGSVVTTVQSVVSPPPGNPIQRRDYAWTSDSSDGTWFVITDAINGVPEFHFIPDTGSTQPTNGYAVTVKMLFSATTTDLSADLLAGQGTALSNATPSVLCSSVPIKDGTVTTPVPGFVSGPVKIAGSGCGNSKTGRVVVMWR